MRKCESKEKRSNIWLLIPAYNVEQYLDELVDEALKYIFVQNVLVVDDGSDDRTSEITRDKGVNLIKHTSNRGKGAALRTGFDYILEQEGEWIITIDGDLQHDPSKLPEFIEHANSGEYDVIIGVRQRSHGGMPWDRRFSNWSTSLVLSLITGKKIVDSQCGYRMVRSKMLEGLNFLTDGYEFETEYLLKLIRAGVRICWIEIPTRYDGESSAINRFSIILKFLKVVIKFIIHRT
ncbi:MAG: glycosyltransferase family 2 protein [Candidatus Hatepunaea meridiana]|nr:glycosyltransferase family 2 protein [Candidatus Hatepunaea meridiana]